MKTLSVLFAAAAAAAAPMIPAAAASVYEVRRQEETCPQDGAARALRQTVVIIDEAAVQADPKANQRWVRAVVEAADAGEASRGTLGPRERFAIFVARRDGSELVPLFAGCSPNIPDAEFKAEQAADTSWRTFVGTDAASRRKSARTAFSDGVAASLAQIHKQAAEIAASPAPPGALLSALRNVGALARSGEGAPRYVIVSPFQIGAKPEGGAIPAARAKGFALARASGVDFGRAEVYLVGAHLPAGAAQEFVRAFLLGAKAALAGVRSDGLPPLSDEPASLRVFQGFIDYVGDRRPMQARIAASSKGDLVNSWVEIAGVEAVATPLAGKLLCRKPDQCELKGDGRFAMAWSDDPQKAPDDRGELPFGGARNVALVISGDTAKGSVSDPIVVFQGEERDGRRPELKDLTFEISRVDGSPF
ncbi:hypothetical protein GCM10008171_13100 [Methylopila jiangsuensis]|uniref:Uncharacterized protein n=1 Tax=Methylopila jiangsuensis TaxID=586230 RepID=A0A9W6JGL9_9HYPH|nr:hypothetical protein [Methylopila jiangsuensis]MDR6286293.1 hypothetical protein [Methylopila jiangsuensis]GLK76056.1 hypothetical protein GCM10008171_13100 [Methylopila jiangsuensis]